MPVQIDSPASPLAILLKREHNPRELIILSGPSGVGKSTWCTQLAEQARSFSLVVGGLISSPVYEDGHKIGIDLVDQLSNECRRLAVQRNGAPDGIATANWLFDAQVLAWGNQKLGDLPPCDCIILDELGPLEFFRGQGLQAGLKLIDDRRTPLMVVVIRPKLLPLAEERWPWGRVTFLQEGRANNLDPGEPVNPRTGV